MWDKLLELNLFNDKKLVGLKDASLLKYLKRLSDSWTYSQKIKI
jgi:hypothetical protein